VGINGGVLMVRVLFVCLGNICRSPMAEAVFRNLVKKEGLDHKIEIDSAGTGGWHIGNPPHEGTTTLLLDKNISTEGIKARQVVDHDLDEFHYIIAMDAQNLGDLHRLAGSRKTGYIGRLLDFVPDSNVEDVPDPYFTGNFNEVYELVEKGSKNLLEFIREQEGM
jgi:protein-tyrosine phosphatase